VWLFNLVGTIDLLNALRHVDVARNLGSAWYISTRLVPVLLITHFMIYVRLLKPVAESSDAAVILEFPDVRGHFSKV